MRKSIYILALALCIVTGCVTKSRLKLEIARANNESSSYTDSKIEGMQAWIIKALIAAGGIGLGGGGVHLVRRGKE